MIKKLRIKFIIVAILAVVVVLSVILGVVNIINFNSVTEDADYILEVLAENGGKFPEYFKKSDQGPREDVSDEDMKPDDTVPDDNKGGGREKNSWASHGSISQETPYETRFFSILLDEYGKAKKIDTGKISAVNTETAAEMAVAAVESGKEKGYIGDYRFLVSESEDGCEYIIFVDRSKILESARKFLMFSVLIALIGIAMVSVLIIILSGTVTRPAAESYEKQKRFITDAGHEIKTPLAIINADIEVMEMDQEDGEEENEWLADIKVQTKRLADLTGSMIMLSKMEEEPDKAEFVEFPISDVVEELAGTFKSRAVARNKTLAINVEQGVTMNGDEKGIGRLVSILLDNAMKYSLEDTEITVNLEKRGRNVLISVGNECEPVKKENLDRMFDRFYRMDGSRNSKTGGYGIGLSIAQAIVNRHKGKIQATTVDGNQIMITASLPM